MKIPVYLVRAILHDRFGMEYQFRERRLVRQNPEDKVIAIIEAPRGSWIRTRPDEHGMDQLIVPARSSIWSRYLGMRRAIPVKYVINCARVGEHGLSVAWLAGSSTEEVTAAAKSASAGTRADEIREPKVVGQDANGSIPAIGTA